MAKGKKVSDRPIEEFDCCPHCGGTGGYYTHHKVSGYVQDNHTFAGVPENSNMHDSLKYKLVSKYRYCLDCNEPICKV